MSLIEKLILRPKTETHVSKGDVVSKTKLPGDEVKLPKPRFTEKKVRTTLDDISEEKKAKIRKTLKEKAAILKEEYRYIDD